MRKSILFRALHILVISLKVVYSKSKGIIAVIIAFYLLLDVLVALPIHWIIFIGLYLSSQKTTKSQQGKSIPSLIQEALNIIFVTS